MASWHSRVSRRTFTCRFPAQLSWWGLAKNDWDLKRAEEQSSARRGIVVREGILTCAVASFAALELPSFPLTLSSAPLSFRDANPPRRVCDFLSDCGGAFFGLLRFPSLPLAGIAFPRHTFGAGAACIPFARDPIAPYVPIPTNVLHIRCSTFALGFALCSGWGNNRIAPVLQSDPEFRMCQEHILCFGDACSPSLPFRADAGNNFAPNAIA